MLTSGTPEPTLALLLTPQPHDLTGPMRCQNAHVDQGRPDQGQTVTCPSTEAIVTRSEYAMTLLTRDTGTSLVLTKKEGDRNIFRVSLTTFALQAQLVKALPTQAYQALFVCGTQTCLEPQPLGTKVHQCITQWYCILVTGVGVTLWSYFNSPTRALGAAVHHCQSDCIYLYLALT